jgi:hypothetical protein
MSRHSKTGIGHRLAALRAGIRAALRALSQNTQRNPR